MGGDLTDPATNRVLAVHEDPIANVEITAVDAKYATGTFVQTGASTPQRSDIVVSVP
jgi:hypothetical protein